MAQWLRSPRQTVVAMRNGILGGFGVVRPCLSGHKVGPLFAADDAAACAILRALAQTAGGEISIDVPEQQKWFSQTLAKAAMTLGFTTARMYRGKAPVLHEAGVYGVSTLELG